jgi:hypothetical protein
MLPSVVLLADYAGTLEVSNRTEFRVRLTEVPSGTAFVIATPGSSTPAAAATVPNPGLDLVDIPELHLDLKQHSAEYKLDYSAFTIEPDMELGATVPQVLQSAALGAAWHDERLRLGAIEYGQFGVQNSAYLALASTTTTMPPPAQQSVQPLANPETVDYGASRSDLNLRYQFSRRSFTEILLEYGIQGGLGAASQTILPVVQGPRAEALIGYKASRVDTVETHLIGATSSSTPIDCSPYLINPLPNNELCQPNAYSAQLTEMWRRQLTRHSEVWIGAGPGLVLARLSPDYNYTHAVYPIVVAGFQYARTLESIKPVLRFDFQVAPLIDVRTGIIDDRAQGTLTLTVPIRYLKLTGSLSGSRSVDPLFAEPVTSILGNFEADYRLESYVSLGGGIRYAWQEQTLYDQTTQTKSTGVYSTGMLFVQATFRAPTLRF